MGFDYPWSGEVHDEVFRRANQLFSSCMEVDGRVSVFWLGDDYACVMRSRISQVIVAWLHANSWDLEIYDAVNQKDLSFDHKVENQLLSTQQY